MVSELPSVASPPPNARTFGADVLLTVGGKAIFVALGGLLVVVSARVLGPSGQGIFAVAVSLLMVLIQIGNLGLAVSSPYFTARNASDQRAIAVTLIRVAVLVSAVLCAVAAATRALVPGALPGVDWLVLAVTLGGVPAAIAALYLQGVLLGQQRMIPYNLMDIAQVATALLALAALLAVSDVQVIDVVVVTSAGRYVSLLIALWALRGLLRSALPSSAPGLAGRLLKRGMRVYVVSLLAFVLIRLDLLLVNALLGSADAGQYSIAGYVTEALIVVPMVVGNMMLPRLARTAGAELGTEAFRAVGALWALLCLASVPAVYVAIPVVFGDRYDQAAGLYAWLALGTFCLGMLNTLTIHFVVAGYPRKLIVVWVVVLGVNIAANLLLLPSAGVTAAPIISTVTYAAVFAAHVRVFAGEVGGYRALRPEIRELPRMVRTAFGR